MLYEGRPRISCLVAFYCAPFGLLTEPKVMPLEDAADYARYGFVVLVDPQDQQDLAMWEILERTTTAPRRKWFDRP